MCFEIGTSKTLILIVVLSTFEQGKLMRFDNEKINESVRKKKNPSYLIGNVRFDLCFVISNSQSFTSNTFYFLIKHRTKRTLKLTSHGLLHYLWSVDLSKMFSQSIFVFLK